VGLVKCNEIPFVYRFSKLWDDIYGIISSDAHVEMPWLHFISQNFVAQVCCRRKVDNTQLRSPVSKLFHPVRYRAFRGDDQMRTTDILCLQEVANKSDGLDRLTHAHVICKQAVHVILV
jgi:hypothetical protein